MIKLEKYQAGKWIQEPTGYRYFLPNPINEEWSWEDQSINHLLEKAAVKLGELNAFSSLVPNIDLFIRLHVTKEAVVSSRIEGTQTHMDEALLDEAEIIPTRRGDWLEVRNYTKALNYAINKLDNLPVSTRLIKETHRILMYGVRGEHKLPGEYRTSQNWIGGQSLNDAVFIPPHHLHIHPLMSDLEKFLHNPDIQVPALIRMAIAHYQFETIHPFLDGNGRMGRLLITLFLVDQNILQRPLLYPSVFFEKNKALYYDNLTRVRTHNEMKQWLKYFLVGITQTAEDAIATLSRILELKERLELKISSDFGRKGNHATLLLNHLFENPIINVNQVKEWIGSTYKTANNLIAHFEQAGILKEMTGQHRNRLFIFEEYVKLFES